MSSIARRREVGLIWWLVALAGIAGASFMVTLKAEAPLAPAEGPPSASGASDSAAVDDPLEEAFAEAAGDAERCVDQTGVHRGGGAAGNILASVSGRLEFPGELLPLDPVRPSGSALTEAS